MEKKKNVMLMKLSKAIEDQKFSAPALDLAFFQFPGSRMWDEYRAKASMHRRVDIAARAIAHHPTVRFHNFELVDHAFVQTGIFFQHDFDGVKIRLQAGTLHLSGLLGRLALGDHNQAMMFRQIRQSLWNAFEYVGWRGFQFRCHSLNLFHQLALRSVSCKFQVGVFQRAAKAAHAVTMLADIAPFGFVQDVANIFARVTKMFQLCNEMIDGLLKENIVFPEGVVRVDQYCVPSHTKLSRSPERKSESILPSGQTIYLARLRK